MTDKESIMVVTLDPELASTDITLNVILNEVALHHITGKEGFHHISELMGKLNYLFFQAGVKEGRRLEKEEVK